MASEAERLAEMAAEIARLREALEVIRDTAKDFHTDWRSEFSRPLKVRLETLRFANATEQKAQEALGQKR